MTNILVQKPAHSPLGASSAERWMNCSGSVALIKRLGVAESDDPDYRRLGTHAHALAALCLQTETDAWEHAGEEIEGIVVSAETVRAVTVFVEECRSLIPTDGEPYTAFIEQSFSSPVHPLFYGTTDFAVLLHNQRKVKVRDYKHGEGITVDVDYNPQVRYYGYGVVQGMEDQFDEIDYAIVQPRGFHPDGIVRRWSESVAALTAWVHEDLVPAMERAELEIDFVPGDWCRFCPAKLACPVLKGLHKALVQANPKEIAYFTDEDLDRIYPLIEAAKFFLKEVEKHAYNRLNSGTYTGTALKLVRKKANRVFKPEAEAIFAARFPDEYRTPPEMKSPAEMEKISAAARELVHEYAYTPETGLTVALASDKRTGVAPQSAAAKYGVAALQQSGDDDGKSLGQD